MEPEVKSVPRRASGSVKESVKENGTAERPTEPSVQLDGSDHFSRELLNAMLAFRSGDFSVRMPSDETGLRGKIADAFNDILAISERRAEETARVSRVVGK